jgi:hypothetical protein
MTTSIKLKVKKIKTIFRLDKTIFCRVKRFLLKFRICSILISRCKGLMRMLNRPQITIASCRVTIIPNTLRYKIPL